MILSRIPIGPSINNVYKPIRGRFVKSVNGRIYDQKIEMYKLRHFKLLEQIHAEFKDKLLCIDKYFIFPYKELYCKDGSVKRKDLSNYLKTTEDGLARLLSIDDKFFRSGILEALTCANEKDSQLIVKISLHTNRDYDTLRNDCESLGIKI